MLELGSRYRQVLSRKVVQSIITTGEYKHPYLGVTGGDVTPQLAKIFGLIDAKGFLVTNITPSSPASKAGFHTGGVSYDQQGQITNSYGDIIIKIDGNDVRKIDDILTYLEREKKVNDTVTLTLIRDNQLTGISVVLGSRTGQFGDQSASELGGGNSDCPSYVPQTLCDLFAQ